MSSAGERCGLRREVTAASGMPSHVTLVITLVGQRVAIAAGGLGRHPSRVTGVPPGRYRLAYPT